MLVLTLKAGTSVRVADGESATVVRVLEVRSGGSVIVGVDAPRSLKISRHPAHGLLKGGS
jgi:sRNA-binding carbon storage regulator CsrA